MSTRSEDIIDDGILKENEKKQNEEENKRQLLLWQACMKQCPRKITPNGIQDNIDWMFCWCEFPKSLLSAEDNKKLKKS